MVAIAARPKTEAREARWSELQTLGYSSEEIARRYGRSVRTVQLGIQRHRLRDGLEPDDVKHQAPRPIRVTMCYGPKPFTPSTSCDDIHPYGPIPRGSSCCCASCHQFGQDGAEFLYQHPDWDITARIARAELEAAERAKAEAEAKARAEKRAAEYKQPIRFKPRITAKARKAVQLASAGLETKAG